MAAPVTQATLEQSASRLEKALRWLFFGVLMSLVPFAAVVLDDIDRGIRPSWSILFGQGELLIVAVIIAAGGIGELFGTEVKNSRRVAKLIVLGFSVTILVTASIWFADVSSLVVSKHPPQPGTVAAGSIAIFIFTIMTGISSLLLSEG